MAMAYRVMSKNYHTGASDEICTTFTHVLLTDHMDIMLLTYHADKAFVGPGDVS